MNSSTLTLNANIRTSRIKSTKTVTAAQMVRLITRKWDMIAVIGLMTSSAAYGVFALAHVA
ncbi:MAG: hypothetical protein ACRYFS_07100 [Janthinobacterium lividum]